jgi:hypothetical protein
MLLIIVRFFSSIDTDLLLGNSLLARVFGVSEHTMHISGGYMIKASQQFSLIALVCSVSLVCASPSWADMVALKADLKASNEVPPNESKGRAQ